MNSLKNIVNRLKNKIRKMNGSDPVTANEAQIDTSISIKKALRNDHDYLSKIETNTEDEVLKAVELNASKDIKPNLNDTNFEMCAKINNETDVNDTVDVKNPNIHNSGFKVGSETDVENILPKTNVMFFNDTINEQRICVIAETDSLQIKKTNSSRNPISDKKINNFMQINDKYIDDRILKNPVNDKCLNAFKFDENSKKNNQKEINEPVCFKNKEIDGNKTVNNDITQRNYSTNAKFTDEPNNVIENSEIIDLTEPVVGPVREIDETKFNIDIISLSSDEEFDQGNGTKLKHEINNQTVTNLKPIHDLNTIPISTLEEEQDSDGYHSSDFEFISENEAKMSGIIYKYPKINKELYGTKNEADSKPGCSNGFESNTEDSFQDNGLNTSKASENRVLPAGENYLNLFRGVYDPVLPHSAIFFLENKSIRPIRMNVDYEGMGFDMQLMRSDSSDTANVQCISTLN
ncbi:uncharacterized protein LOC119629567 isoform X2 [Bombyx mori]|uniref:Uncharacterized protein n=1 Tax=Bombyx mori TaxID=7091 RepID=A0A8R2M1G4_BOMMO|nr:uncharacterized protein LOC119629567 isoform X2 [Bombyx mori]